MDVYKISKIIVICLLIIGIGCIGIGVGIDIYNTVTETEKLETERHLLYWKEICLRFDIEDLQKTYKVLDEQMVELQADEQDTAAFWVGYKEAAQSLIYLKLYKFLENNDDIEIQYAEIVKQVEDYYNEYYKKYTNMYTDDYLIQPIDKIIKSTDDKAKVVAEVYDILKKYASAFEGQTYLP